MYQKQKFNFMFSVPHVYTYSASSVEDLSLSPDESTKYPHPESWIPRNGMMPFPYKTGKLDPS